jgi:LPXTG-site transpeptidase (sortase) family protein
VAVALGDRHVSLCERPNLGTVDDVAEKRARRGAGVPAWALAVGGLLLAVVGATLPWTVRAVSTWAGHESPGVEAPVVAAGGAGVADHAPFVVEPEVRMEAAASPPARPAPAAGRPTRLIVPSLGVNAPVIDIGVVDGVLLPPDDPRTLGWWADGAVPGALRGGALITGHTVHSGGGAFDNLETLRKGDAVQVRTAKGLIRYAVTGVTVYRKASLAKDAEKVFSQTVPGRLVLITCEDWNGSGYDSNAIVFAERIPA